MRHGILCLETKNLPMTNSEQILDTIVVDRDLNTEEVEVTSFQKFLLLAIASFGLYQIYWMYRTWRFFKEKDNLDVMPVWRAIFGIFFISSLFENIKNFARRNGSSKDYSSAGLAVGFFFANLLGRLPEPYWILSLVSILCFMSPLQAFEEAIENSPAHTPTKSGIGGGEIVVLVLGASLWALILVGLFSTY
jgi:hypothetical protein